MTSLEKETAEWLNQAHLKQFPFPSESSLATSWQSSRSIVLIGSLSWNTNSNKSKRKRPLVNW